MAGFFIVQILWEPYYDTALNNMERMSLMVIILTIYCGLFYQAGEGDEVVQSSFFIWIIFFSVLTPTFVFAINFGI